MRLTQSKKAILAVIALIVVCGTSFFVVKSLNDKTPRRSANNAVTANAPITSTTAAPSTTAPTTTAPTTQAPTTTLKAPDGSQDRFTTFADDSSTTAYQGSFTTTLPTTTYTPVTPSSPLVTTQTAITGQEDPQQVLDEAKSQGFLGYQYDPNGKYYFTANDPWQRNFGFNLAYDFGASFMNFYYDTFRCKFTYKDKDWLIQFWKGQYGLVFVGAEIGCYYKPLDRDMQHYDAVAKEDELYMSMTFYRKGEERFTREYAQYWWCTGFVPGTLDSFRDRSELTMKARVTMKDKEMLELFTASLEKNGLHRNKEYTTSGLDVYISWT